MREGLFAIARATTLATLLTSACSGAPTTGLTGAPTKLLDLQSNPVPLAGASFAGRSALPPRLPLPASPLPPRVVKPPPNLSRLAMIVPLTALGVTGPTLSGMSLAESRTTLEGFDISNPAFGSASLHLPMRVLESITVWDASYHADQGWASGGQIAQRRFTGYNRFRGEAGLRIRPRFAQPRLLFPSDDALRVTEIDSLRTQLYANVAGPIAYDRLFYSVGVSATRTLSALTQSFHAACSPGDAADECVAGDPGRATKKFAEQTFPTGSLELAYLAGLDWHILRRHHLALTAAGGASFVRTSYRRPYSPEPNAFGTNPGIDPLGGGSRNATGVVNDHLGTTLRHQTVAILGYEGELLNGDLDVDATLGYAQFVHEDAWRLDNPRLRDIPATQYTSASGRELSEFLDRDGATALVPGVEAACNDGRPGVACPIHTWVSGGLGEYDRDVARRLGARLALTGSIDSRRSHRLSGGVEFEWSQRHGEYRYSGSNDPDYDTCGPGQLGGGEYCYDPAADRYSFDDGPRVNNNRFVLVNADNPALRETRGFGTARHEQGDLRALVDAEGHGVRVEGYDERVSSLHYGLFLSDNWRLTPDLTVEAGLRWEIQDLRDIYGQSQILLVDGVAPRVGVVYDWTQSGRSRLYANYGRYDQPLPLQLASRMFGGLVSVGRQYRASDCGGADEPPSEYCVDAGGFTTGANEPAIVPRLRSQFNHRLALGYDHEIVDDLVLGVRWEHTDLGRAIEDVSTNGGLDFVLANPGVAVRDEDIEAQRGRCEQLEAELDARKLGAAPHGAAARELRHCEFLVDAYEHVGSSFDKPTRRYDALTVQLDKRIEDNWTLRVNYTLSRLVGNYDGFVDPINGSIDLGASAQYDTPEQVRNSTGPLARDVPHRLRIDGAYLLDLKRSGLLLLGSGLRVRSGAPVSVRAGPTYLLPRGAGGRVEPTANWNLFFGYSYPLPRDVTIEVNVSVLNVTNASATLRVNENYTYDRVRPVAGGGIDELAHAKVAGSDRKAFFGREIIAPSRDVGATIQLQQPVTAEFELVFRF
ncbi:Oar protein [Enhygromyxa salina]|uniref:Oar protein n=1 Tax=Enhygromyxa salina TaxID=215803 RepID=A0A0C2DI41_9BACT|nr:Oar protein [Enhygromyxa salina]